MIQAGSPPGLGPAFADYPLGPVPAPCVTAPCVTAPDAGTRRVAAGAACPWSGNEPSWMSAVIPLSGVIRVRPSTRATAS